MKKLILAAAAAAFLIPAAVATPASAQDVSVRIGSDGYRHDNGHHYGWRNHGYRSYAYSSGCRTVTIRERHHGRVIIKKVRRCH